MDHLNLAGGLARDHAVACHALRMTVDANFPHRDSPRLQDFLDRGAQLSRRTHALGRFTAEPELLREVEAFIEESRPLPGVRLYTTTGGGLAVPRQGLQTAQSARGARTRGFPSSPPCPVAAIPGDPMKCTSSQTQPFFAGRASRAGPQ